MKLTLSAADVKNILRLPDTDAVDELVAAKVLDVAAFTRTGQPLFDADAVRRAAIRIVGQQQRRAKRTGLPSS